MSYLLDKKIKRKKIIKISLGVVIFIFLFYFRSGVFNGFSSISQVIFRPVFILGNNFGEKLKNVGSYFAFKNSLEKENENLKSQIAESQADRANYISVVDENNKMKELLGRKSEKANMILAAILSKPNQSLYDTLVIDQGAKNGVKVGDLIFAGGFVPIGRAGMVYDGTSKIILFSSPGEKTQVIVSGKDIFMELVGRGGGNFEMIVPKDFILQKGDQVILPGINSYVVAVVQTIISDPRDPFTKALLSSPVNIQELKFVEIEQ